MHCKKSMTIRYNNTRGDLIFVNIRTILHNRLLLAIWAIGTANICYSALQGPKIQDTSLGMKIFLCVFVGGIFSVFLFASIIAMTTAMILLKKNKGVLGEHLVSISDEGIVESTIYNESLHRWSAYHKTVSTSRFLLLYANEGQYLVISRKRPLIEGDLVAFEAALNEKTRKVSNASQVPTLHGST